MKVPTDPIANYLEYIEEGEGSWALTTEGNHGGKKTYTSAENIDTVELPVPYSRTTDQDKQLNLETGIPTEINEITDASMAEEIVLIVKKYRER